MKRRSKSSGNTVRLVNSDGHMIGLDIGATAVRAAAIVRDDTDVGPTIAVHSLGEVALPSGVVVNGMVRDEQTVSTAIKNLWRDNGFNCHNVVIGTTNQQIVVRELEVPALSAEQRAQALPFLAREVVALPLDEALLDFAPLGGADPETGMTPGLLIAAPRLPVLSAVRAAEAAGLKVARVDLSSFAALRFVAHAHLSVEAVIDFGAHLTSIVIHRLGVPKVVRTVARGGQELTDRLVDRLSMTPEQAESAKREQGIGDVDDVSQLLREAVRPLLAEVRSSLHFFATSSPDVELERISMTGGAAQLPGLAEQLSSQHGVPAHVISPVEHLMQRWSGRHARFESAGFAGTAVSVGLAMGAAA